MLIWVGTPGGVYWKPQSYPQILTQKIVWSGYARYKRICLLIYNMLNKHTRFMQIVIGFHPILTLEIEYDYYDNTSRLLAHARSGIIGD